MSQPNPKTPTPRRWAAAPVAMAAAFCTACALALATSAAVAADDQAAPPTVTTTALTGNLHLLQGRGGNVVASIGEDGVLIIDDDYEEMVPAYEAALTDLVGADANPRLYHQYPLAPRSRRRQPVLGRSRRGGAGAQQCPRAHVYPAGDEGVRPGGGSQPRGTHCR